MIPYIQTPVGDIPTFALMVTCGILAMILCLLYQLRKANDPIAEQNYILPKLAVAGLLAILSAGIFDFLVKLPQMDTLRPQGISFYGGLIGGAGVLYFLCRISRGESEYSIKKWFDVLTIPLILFHIFGRMGCFLGGCCYGKYTDSCLGVYFPDQPAYQIFHHGLKCYPTQLFEICLLIMILVLICFRKNKFRDYLALYAIGRFAIEFFRGDNRGNIFLLLSPAQWTSILLLIAIIACGIYKHQKQKHA